LPLGMWDEAAASDEAAWRTSVELARRKGLSVAQHDFHALGWLQYEYLQQGRVAQARALVGEIDRALAPNGPSKGGRYDRNGAPDAVSAVSLTVPVVVSGSSRTVPIVVSGFSRTVPVVMSGFS